MKSDLKLQIRVRYSKSRLGVFNLNNLHMLLIQSYYSVP